MIANSIANINIIFGTTKFWSSECKGKFTFTLLSRDKILQGKNFGAANAEKSCTLAILTGIDYEVNPESFFV